MRQWHCLKPQQGGVMPMDIGVVIRRRAIGTLMASLPGPGIVIAVMPY